MAVKVEELLERPGMKDVSKEPKNIRAPKSE